MQHEIQEYQIINVHAVCMAIAVQVVMCKNNSNIASYLLKLLTICLQYYIHFICSHSRVTVINRCKTLSAPRLYPQNPGYDSYISQCSQ